VVEAAEHAVEEIALGGCVAVSIGSSPVVVRSGTWGGGQAGERPDVADRGQTLVLDPAGHDREASAGRPGDRRGPGEGLEAFRVGESGSVVADLGEHPGAGE
jgi:hypothetical protein